jgi:hypothetical protein
MVSDAAGAAVMKAFLFRCSAHQRVTSKATVCCSALEVRAGICGLCMDGECLQSCSAVQRSLPDLQWLHGGTGGPSGVEVSTAHLQPARPAVP